MKPEEYILRGPIVQLGPTEIARPDHLFPDPFTSVSNTFEPLTQLNVRCRPRIILRFELFQAAVSAAEHSFERTTLTF